MRIALTAVSMAAAGLVVLAEAQTPQQRPEFEVASVKASATFGSGAVMIGKSASPGTVTLTGTTLRELIVRAYSLKAYQIVGPKWLDDDRYDIVAKSPGGATDAEQKLMLQSLLALRFAMAVHTETRMLNAYELVPGKGGAKLHEVKADDTGARVYPGKSAIRASQIPMARFAELLSAKVEAPVLDKTGMTGLFDIDLKWSADPDAEPSIFAALAEQLGLKLDARKDGVPVLVIDHVERPTLN
jgi:uncharacterized protein (TIGR03435 family)